jgi:hypothetical protein
MPYDENGKWIEYTGELDPLTEPPGPPPPGYVPTIKGYGTRAIISNEPGNWMDESGAPARPENVTDIENVVDTENISDPALKAGIAAQARIPSKPSDQALNTFSAISDALKRHDDEFKKEAEQKAVEAEKIYLGRTPTIDAVLMKPAEIAQRDANARAAKLNAFNHHYNALRDEFKGFAEKELIAQTKDRNPNQTEEQLINKMHFDPNPTEREKAKVILDTIQKRKEDAAAATQVKKDAGIDVPGLAKAVADGQDAPIAIKGSMGNPLAAKVKSEVLKGYPKFSFEMADANYKWKQSATNQRTINFAGGSLPRLGALDDQLTKLNNADINMINRVISKVSKEFGKPAYTDYESNRNAIVQEINTALSGTSQGSDMRIKIELENLESARSPSQIRGAISNLREALIARMDVDLSPLYPIEVVRGEKSMGQFKEEMFATYRGKYGKPGESGIVTYYDNGKTYGIPADKEAAFLKARPNAKRGK